jgi:CHAD domain-containing protein
MNGQISRELLAQPAKRGARVIARSRLDIVRAAYERFDATDPNGLHDLRVGLRRLRSWLRAFRPEIDDTVRGKTRRRLRDLTHVTNAARDVEVWQEWIAAQAGLSRRARSGLRYMTKWLRTDDDNQRRKATKRIRARLPRLLDTLEDELSSYSALVPADEGSTSEATMADALAELIRRHHQRFAARIDRVQASTEVGAIHRCRIAAKRLRYLLEALDDFPQAKEATTQLVDLQDALGTVRDLHLFVARVVERIGVVAMIEARRHAAKALAVDSDDAPSPVLSRVRPGMILLAKRAGQQSDAAFEQFRADWDQDRLAALSLAVDGLIDALA